MASHDATVTASKSTLRKVVAASLIGTSLEWYDFFLYATASALVFGEIFFPSTNATMGVLLSLATFGVGFFARPLGAMVFGVVGDRLGRRPSLAATLVLMGLATALVGVLPGYAAIGLWAPALLVMLRLLQGLGAGAEHAGATIFAAEYAPPHRRGLFGSVSSSGLYVGVVLSSSIFALFALLPDEAFFSWGWRVPFLISIALVPIGLYIRLRLDETPDFQEAEQVESATPLRTTFVEEWRSVLTVLGIVAAPFVATYTYQTYALAHLDNNVGVSGVVGTLSLTVAAAIAIAAVPLAAALSDRIGRRPVVIGGAVYSALFAFPFFWLIETGSPLAIGLAMIGGVGVGVPLMLGPQGALLVELFSTRGRFTGFAMSRELGSMIFAGATPFLAALLVTMADGRPWPVSLYVILASALSVLTAMLIKETKPMVDKNVVRSVEPSATGR